MLYSGGTYSTSYSINVPNAYLGAKSYYYWRCFYLCTAGNPSSSEMTGGASFTVASDRLRRRRSRFSAAARLPVC